MSFQAVMATYDTLRDQQKPRVTAVLVAVATWADADGYLWQTTPEAIARVTGYSATTVHSTLTQAERMGLIRWTGPGKECDGTPDGEPGYIQLLYLERYLESAVVNWPGSRRSGGR